MSGPKCSQYQLNEQRRREELRRIEEELRREEERRIEEQRRLEEERRREEERRKAEERREREIRNVAYNAELEERVKKLRDKIFKKREQEIIAEAIDEAMVELGYDLIAATEPKEETAVNVQAQVFSFSEGVGVQVIETEGRVSMEIVGLGTNNRRPTDKESEYLEMQMNDFCNAYGKLEAKLKEKGIVKVDTIRRLPPNKKYARILNVDNFTKTKETTTLQIVMKQSAKQSQTVSATQKLAVQKKRYSVQNTNN